MTSTSFNAFYVKRYVAVKRNSDYEYVCQNLLLEFVISGATGSQISLLYTSKIP